MAAVVLSMLGVMKFPDLFFVDLEKMAIGAGIKRTRTIADAGAIADGARLIRDGNGTAFVVLRVKPTEPPSFKRSLDPALARLRFRQALLGRA